MSTRVNIYINPQGHRRHHTHFTSNSANQRNFTAGFCIDLPNPFGQCCLNFSTALANTGKDDIGGGNAGRQRAFHLTAGDDIRPSATLGKQGNHTQSGVGFQGEMYFAANRRYGRRKIIKGRSDASTRIDVKRAAIFIRDLIERDVINQQLASLIAMKGAHYSIL